MSGGLRKLEWVWRHRVVYPVFRLILNNAPAALPVDAAQVKSVLFLRHDRIGDYIVTTPVLGALKRRYPNLQIGMIASERNVGIIRDQRLVDEIHLIPKSIAGIYKGIREARRRRYDIIVNLVFNRTTTGGLLANLIGPRAVKIGQGAEKYRFYFNALVSVDHANEHMADAIRAMIEMTFGITLANDEQKYLLDVTPASLHRASKFLERHLLSTRTEGVQSRRYAVFNISAVESYRMPSERLLLVMLKELLQSYAGSIVMISAPSERGQLEQLRKSCKAMHVFLFPEDASGSIADVSAIVKHAELVVTPDTSVVHIACAHSVPLFALYAESANKRWLPRGTMFRAVYSSTGRVDGIDHQVCRDELRKFIEMLESSMDKLNESTKL